MDMRKIIDIIDLLGGDRHIAYEFNLHPRTVSRWPHNKTGIPKKYWKPLADLDKSSGVTIAAIKAAHTNGKKK